MPTAPRTDVNLVRPSSALFEREFFGPPPIEFAWPLFEFISFYDHHGSFRESWSGPSCSVANRPTDVPPSEGKYHFIMDVHAFLAVYPHEVLDQTSGVTCTFGAWANHTNWHLFVRSGELFASAEEFLFMMYVGRRSALEHPPSALEVIVGPPTSSTHAFEHGDPHDRDAVTRKTFLWWLRFPGEAAP